jgi:predicted helicase
MAYPRIDISRPFTEEINDVENRGLVAPRQTRETVGGLVTNAPTNHKAFSAHDKNQIYPLYLPPTSFEEDFGEDPKPNDNFNNTFIRALENATNLDYSGIGRGDLSEGEFGAEQAFDYIYAFMWSDIYRNRYKELMRIDHPRIPLPPNSEAFTKISQIGAELSSLHLLEIAPPSSSMPGFPVDGTNYIDGYPSYNSEQKRVYINDHQYFEGISEEVWNYEIGGHQVAHTWLKERSRRTLSSMDEFDVYRRIIGVVEKTIELTEQLDELLITLDGFPLNDP